MKGTIHKGKIAIMNRYVPNVNAPNFIKQTLINLKAQKDSNTMIERYFNTPLSIIDRSSRPKISN
jgi:hypothetical protein